MILKPEHYTNRELSWLDFNFRVLEEADDLRNPLFERLKFLAITASNLDEFFMVRVAGLKQQIDAGFTKADPAGLTPKQQLKMVSQKIHRMTNAQYKTLDALQDELSAMDVKIIRAHDLNDEEKAFCQRYFDEMVSPVLTPMAVDASRPFPQVAQKTLNMALRLSAPESEESLKALVQVPSILPRYLKFANTHRYIMLEDIMLLNIHKLFEGFKVKGMVLFRIIRDNDLTFDEDAADLLEEIEKSLKRRRTGNPVRLEMMDGFDQEGIDEELQDFLTTELNARKRDIYLIPGPLDLTFLFAFSSLKGFDHLRYSVRPPLQPSMIHAEQDIFEAIQEHDILTHHPYESFDCVVDFIVQAAKDPNVLAIKQTLYRVSGQSPIVAALIRAAQSGKQVTVLVELKARFDEENNIVWARALEQAGCHVIYGLVGLKVHCKATLVVRRENDGIRRYVHLATGNYNDKTAKLYTDYGLFTSRDAFSFDVSALFNLLTGYSLPPKFKKLHVAPTGLRTFFEGKIKEEIKNAKQGLPAHIMAKVNSLIDPSIIEKLYEASQAGVKIDLIVRGINGLRSKVEDLSENIRVISIIGRYLEHHRIFIFASSGDHDVYLASADWMQRNLDRRIEVLFPIEQEDIKRRIIEDMELMLSDNQKAREQQANGKFKHVKSKAWPIACQKELYKRLKARHKSDLSAPDVVFVPKKRPQDL